jgi:hypothetical protein
VNGLTWATFVLALATAGLVLVAYRQMRLARAGTELSVRPLLVDPSPLVEPVPQETILFGAPGRISPAVGVGALFSQSSDGAFHLSVPFENAGGGVAAIQGASIEPEVDADIKVSRRFVRPGATVRVNISVLTQLPGAARFRDQWWAMEPLAVSVSYTDASGRQPMVSKAVFTQAATQGPWISRIEVYHGRRRRMLTTGTGSY